jgi:hypothetical protein
MELALDELTSGLEEHPLPVVDIHDENNNGIDAYYELQLQQWADDGGPSLD